MCLFAYVLSQGYHRTDASARSKHLRSSNSTSIFFLIVFRTVYMLTAHKHSEIAFCCVFSSLRLLQERRSLSCALKVLAFTDNIPTYAITWVRNSFFLFYSYEGMCRSHATANSHIVFLCYLYVRTWEPHCSRCLSCFRSKEILYVYQISYVWYSMIASTLVVLVGIIVSLITGELP